MIATIAAIAEKKSSAITSILWKPGFNGLKCISVVYVVQTEVFNGFTSKTVLSILFNQMKNDPRYVVSEELNLKWQNQVESELRVLMPWRGAWRYRGHLLRITTSYPHAVTMRDDIEDLCVEEADYGNIYIFWGTLFFLFPFQKFIM